MSAEDRADEYAEIVVEEAFAGEGDDIIERFFTRRQLRLLIRLAYVAGRADGDRPSASE